MKFLLDEHLPVSLCDLIAQMGHEALHVKTQGWLSAGDGDIWRAAAALKATVVSKDSDFLALARRDNRPASLIHLNLGNISNRDLRQSLQKAWPRLSQCLERGDVVVEVRA